MCENERRRWHVKCVKGRDHPWQWLSGRQDGIAKTTPSVDFTMFFFSSSPSHFDSRISFSLQVPMAHSVITTMSMSRRLYHSSVLFWLNYTRLLHNLNSFMAHTSFSPNIDIRITIWPVEGNSKGWHDYLGNI